MQIIINVLTVYHHVILASQVHNVLVVSLKHQFYIITTIHAILHVCPIMPLKMENVLLVDYHVNNAQHLQIHVVYVIPIPIY